LTQVGGRGSLTAEQARQVALDPASIRAIADAMRSTLPEGSAGEGSASRGRRSAEAPQARR